MAVNEKTINEIFLKEIPELTFAGNKPQKFATFAKFKKFIEEELNFWNSYTAGRNFPNILQNYSNMLSYANQVSTNSNESNIKSVFQNILNNINRNYFISSKSDEAQFLTRLYKSNNEQADAAYQVLFFNNVLNPAENYGWKKPVIHFWFFDAKEQVKISRTRLTTREIGRKDAIIRCL